MLDGYGSCQSTVQPQQLVWENVAINSILSMNKLTPPNSPTLPQLIRFPILIFDIRTNGLIDTGAAASLVSSDIYIYILLERKRLTNKKMVTSFPYLKPFQDRNHIP